MRPRQSFRKPFLATLATVFAVVSIAYGSLWMYAVRRSSPDVELGFNNHHNPEYDEKTHSQAVEDVTEGSPAERAGLRPGDRVIAVNGQALKTNIASTEAYTRGQPGDAVELTVERDGEPKPLILHGIFRAVALAGASEGLARSSALRNHGIIPHSFSSSGVYRSVPKAGGTECMASGIAVLCVCRRPKFSQFCGHSSFTPRICVCFSRGVCRNAGAAFLSFFRSVPGAIASGQALTVVEMGRAFVRSLHCHSWFADWLSEPSTRGEPNCWAAATRILSTPV